MGRESRERICPQENTNSCLQTRKVDVSDAQTGLEKQVIKIFNAKVMEQTRTPGTKHSREGKGRGFMGGSPLLTFKKTERSVVQEIKLDIGKFPPQKP